MLAGLCLGSNAAALGNGQLGKIWKLVDGRRQESQLERSVGIIAGDSLKVGSGMSVAMAVPRTATAYMWDGLLVVK